MEYGQQRHEAIGRAHGVVIESVRIADVVLRDHEEFPGLKVFSCKRLMASITPATCASNHVNGERYTACKGCDVGAHHVAQQSVKPIATSGISSTTRQPGRVAAHCVRCGKSSETDTRSIGRVRFVNKGTECVSCWNRKSEVAKSSNSKGAAPKKWAWLKPATITYRTAKGKTITEDLGLRSSRHECERWLEHVHPGSQPIEVIIDGVAVPSFAGEHPLYHGRELPDVCPPKPESFYTFASKAEKPKAAPRKRAKPLPVSAAADEDGDEFGYRVPAPVKPKTNRPSQSRVGRPRKNAAEETLADFGFGSPDELPDFIQWLADMWPPFAFRAPVKAVAPAIAREPVSEPQDAANPTKIQLAKSHGISLPLVYYRLKTRGTVEVDIDPNGSILHTSNTSGVNGVAFVEKRSKWIARGYREGRFIHIGYFDTIEEATAARASFDSAPGAPSETADFGLGDEDWSTPLHKIAKTVAAESEHSDADGNGCARRNGWLPPLSEADDLEYRRSFDEDEATEPMESVAVPEALSEPVEPVSEDVSEPEPAREPELEEWEVRPLSRKERRTYAKAEKRLVKKAQREARAAAGQPPSIASTCRAVIAVGHALYERRK